MMNSSRMQWPSRINTVSEVDSCCGVQKYHAEGAELAEKGELFSRGDVIYPAHRYRLQSPETRAPCSRENLRSAIFFCAVRYPSALSLCVLLDLCAIPLRDLSLRAPRSLRDTPPRSLFACSSTSARHPSALSLCVLRDLCATLPPRSLLRARRPLRDTMARTVLVLTIDYGPSTIDSPSYYNIAPEVCCPV